MKKTISIAFVAFALLSFTSCQKENLVSGNQEPALRTITATFESNGTKTTLDDNVTPLWSVGDEILILNASGCEPITLTTNNIKNSGRTITFTTTFSGDLYAVYPASATTMTSCDGNITFTIPAVQDGTFASANICVAKGDDKDNLVFRNATAVLEFSQTATYTKVLSIRVEAANAIVGPMSVSFNADGTLDTPTTSSLSGKLINAKSTEAKDKYYVAVAPVTTGKIEFEYQKAVEVATVTTDAGKTLAVNKIYACSMDEKEYNIKTGTINGHVYVQVGSVRWAKMNVGATAVTGADSYGTYFAWGETTEHALTTEAKSIIADPDFVAVSTINNAFESTYNFSWSNCPLTNGTYSSSTKNVFTKYVPSAKTDYWKGTDPPDDKITLDLADDAAYVNWGGSWRMPTSAEFKALKDATYWKWEDGGYYVYAPQSGDAGKKNSDSGVTGTYNQSAALLFFPAAGYSSVTDLIYAGSRGRYWSSSLCTDGPSGAYRLQFTSISVYPREVSDRFCGCSVRPVSD